MSVGGNRSPYRPPCGYSGDEAEVYWLGGPWQHYNPEDDSIPRYTNTTSTSESDTPPAEPVPANTYSAADATISAAVCRKLGYKYAVARKAWHGRFGFTDNDGCCTGEKPDAYGAAQTKYLTLSWSANMTWSVDTPGDWVQGEYNLSGAVSVGQYTGVTTLSGCSNTLSITDNYYSGSPPAITSSSTSETDVDSTDPIAAALIGFCNSYCVALASGSVDAYADGILNDLLPYSNDGGTLEVTLANDSVTVVYTAPTETSPNGFINALTYTVSATLSGAYTAADLNADCDALLSNYPLDDDQLYPWRTDGNCTSGPLLTWLENPPAVPTTQWCDYSDGSYAATTLAAYDVGSMILGIPNPAGYDPYYDFRAQIWSDIDCDGGGEGFGIVGYGAYAPSWALYATQWTNYMDSSSLLPGAFSAYNSLLCGLENCDGGTPTYFPGYLHKSKYAEIILLTQPSHDFARPCGPKDAETVDQTSISCYNPDSPGTLHWPDCSNPCAVGEWNDNYPKGDWCLLTWTFNFRDNFTDSGDPAYRPVTGAWNGISCAQECSSFVPCCPAAVYLSNNGESSTNSQTFTLPALAVDDCFGALWQQMPRQWMTDPLWQVPVPPCDMTDGATWTEDDGSGHGDTDSNWYYPQRPWEEARCATPDGAHSIPGGCYIGVESIADINAGDIEGFTQINPPQPGSCWQPWWTWAINQQNTIAAAARFNCDYADPLAVCDDNIELDPP